LPKTSQLWNYHIDVQKDRELDSERSTEDAPVMREIWRLVFTERRTGEEISISFTKEVRDSIVSKLMGGVALGDGQPRI
jgi:hypothetical protein